MQEGELIDFDRYGKHRWCLWRFERLPSPDLEILSIGRDRKEKEGTTGSHTTSCQASKKKSSRHLNCRKYYCHSLMVAYALHWKVREIMPCLLYRKADHLTAFWRSILQCHVSCKGRTSLRNGSPKPVRLNFESWRLWGCCLQKFETGAARMLWWLNSGAGSLQWCHKEHQPSPASLLETTFEFYRTFKMAWSCSSSYSHKAENYHLFSDLAFTTWPMGSTDELPRLLFSLDYSKEDMTGITSWEDEARHLDRGPKATD